jgi:hypothetical protein
MPASETGPNAGTGPRTAPQDDPKSASSRFESFGRKLDEQLGNVAPRVEEEVKKVIAYLNDEVVPQVRQSSSEALRTAAEHLGRLAEHLDSTRRPRP